MVIARSKSIYELLTVLASLLCTFAYSGFCWYACLAHAMRLDGSELRRVALGSLAIFLENAENPALDDFDKDRSQQPA